MAPAMEAWAQETTWDGTDWSTTAPKFADNAFADEGLTVDGHDGKSWETAYVITTAKQFAYFAWIVRNNKTGRGSNYYWKLGADIDLGNHDWINFGGNAGGAFQGHFDGQNHTVSNVTLNVTTNSNYGLLTTIQGASATNLAEVMNLKISGVTFTSTSADSRGGNTRLGGLAGYVKQANISNVDVSNVTFTYTNTITGTNQLGGAIGCMENNTTLDDVDVTGVTATFGNTTTKLYLGGVVGQSGGTANTNSITKCDVKTVKVTHSSNITGETQIGGLVGQANTSLKVINDNTVQGVAGQNSGKGFDVSVSGSTVNFYAGGLLGYTKGDGHEVKGNSVEEVYITNTGTINGGRLGGFIGYVESDNTTSKILVKGNTATTVNIQVGGNTVGTPYLGGFIGQAKGKASPNNRSTIEGNTVTSPTVTMNGEVGHTFYMGGFLGSLDAHANLYNNKVETPNISITNTINAATYVGGAVGFQANYTTIDGMTVTGGSITGPSTDTNVNNGKTFMVGGFIGQQNSSGTAAYQPNVFRNIAVTDININLEHYVPATTITNHKFAVGGIAGSVNAPNKDANGFCGMPENIIFKGGKIYAPYATTSPTVSNFNASNPSHNTMTTEVVVTIDALDKAKTKTWYYSDYELGLSQGFLNSGAVIADNATTAKDKFHRNYTSSATITDRGGISYLTVNNSTFQKSNRFQDSERDSKTVLWWTNTAGYNAAGASADMFTNEEQPIYPHQAGATAPVATAFPYYWYFFQGVSNANYVSSDVATKIIEGIAGNKTEAAKTAPVTLAISNPLENERGFAQRTISVAANTVDGEGNETDVTASYTYQWYVNGVANGTGTSINLTPHWKDGMGITVNALNGSTIVATATYTLAPGVLKTKAGSSEKIRSDINGRGTSANPYIIDCESALRQWSYLSTANTTTRWEDLAMPVDPMTNKASTLVYCHYNRAYYELGADITMGTNPFIPISHVGYGSDGTWGTYSNNFSFQGNFDGKGHKISGLKITWGAGQYKGNKINIYHGLFGLVGHSAATTKWGDGATTCNTVIQNLVIENATLTHDVNNTTFSYKKNYGHITADNYNNCMVGVLAGIVAANTTVQNIEIRGSKITDEGSSDYSLATMGLFVGGAIGSVQGAYNNENIPSNTIIKNIVVGTDIDLTHAKIQDVAIAQQGVYNVGGIIGRFASTNGNLAATQAVMPKYLLYTGSIKATSNTEGKKDALISPVIAATRYSSNKDINLTNISKIWEGNNNGAEQLTVADALYYNFHISDASGNMHLVTEDYPDKVCSNGARAQDTHTDGNETAAGYLAQRYQGVNYNAIFCDAATYGEDADGGKRMAIAILNSHDDVTMYWEWTTGEATPHMTSTRTVGAYIERDAETADKYNVVGTATADDKYYKWYVDGVLQEDQHSSSFTKPADIGDIYIKAEVYENSTAGSPIATTQNLVIKGEFKVNTSISKSGDTYTVGIDRGGIDLTENNLDGRITVTYQWYKGNAVNVNTATLISGETSRSITIDKSALEGFNNLFCHVTISTTTAPIKNLFTGDISMYVREANVVYLQLQDSFTDSKGVTHIKPANSGVGTVDDPVTSWDDAYAKLNGYTVPTKEYVEGHGGTWTSETNFDNETYYLAHKAEYLYDTYKCDGNKRKVKPIEECTNNWDNNIIVLMGLSKDEPYFNNGETNQHNIDGARANKPVTITGKDPFTDVDYHGYLCNHSGDFSINADHRFQYMGFGVYDKGIGATESIRYRIYAHRWNVHAGKGLLMGWAAALEWGIEQTDENKKIYKITSADVSTGTPVGKYACDIAIMGGYLNDNTSTNPEMFEYINHGRDDIGQQIKIESGYWGPVCPGNRQTDSGNTITTYYTMGGPDHPAKTTITVDIDRKWNDGTNRNQFNSAMSPATVDIGCLLTGNHEGTMYADVTLNILSGKMGRMVNGIKGAQRRQIKNPDSFTTNGHYRHTVKYEDWTEIAAPAPDSYFGRGILNFDPSSSENNVGAGNAGVNVVELYCGGLGRGHNDGSYHPEVRSYFYGLCEVNIKGGTFQKTIYGSGAGGTNGIGTATNHTDDDGLPYWNTDLDVADANGAKHVWYAPYDYIKKDHSYNFVKVKVTGTGSDDENLENGYINLEKTRNIINITGGIFGSEEKPVSIYAGGNGETDAALINPSKTKGGDVKNIYNTPNHQAGNMYGATDGLTTQINISGDAKIYGSIYGGGKGSLRYYRYFLRADPADVAYTADNQEYTRIWNPYTTAAGDYNTVNGKDWQNIINSRKNADRYLNLGQIYGNTKVTISGNVEVFGNVYGGGEGVGDITVDELFRSADSELGLADQSGKMNDIIAYEGTATNGKRSAHVVWVHDKFVNFPDMGKIFGNSGVEISGNVTIHGNVYGGGKAGAIQGTTNVDVKGSVNIFGEVYGAGQGLLVDAAKDYKQIATIIGDATVNLSENATIWQDMFGGGQNAVVNGNTHFNMTGGHVAANVFGGGKGDIKKNNDGTYSYVENALVVTSADISGNTNVDITGGDVIWDRTTQADALSITTHTFTKEMGTDGEGNPITDVKIFTDADLAQEGVTLEQKKTELSDYDYFSKTETSPVIRGEVVYWDTSKPSSYKANRGASGNTKPGKVNNTLFYNDATTSFRIEHNIFGGGYIASNVGGTAFVTMTRGLGDIRLTATNQWKDSFKVFAHPHFYCFGGGYGAYTTVSNTKVIVNVTEYDKSLDATVDSPDEQLAPSHRAPNGSGNPLNDNPIYMGVFNNKYGIANATVLGVLGGSYAGFVKNNTEVNIGGETFISRVYGGGFGQLEAFNALQESDVVYSGRNRANLGEVGGNTTVNITGAYIYGDVFGGGAGVKSVDSNDDGTIDKDFTMGEVLGYTTVNISKEAQVFGSVYGGGDVANVTNSKQQKDTDDDGTPDAVADIAANVNITGGTIYDKVFGGGSGRSKKEVASATGNTVPVGKIFGNTRVYINNEGEGEDLIVPTIYNNIYGGCAFGQVVGNTEVAVDGGNIGDNIFGGGLGHIADDGTITSADVNGSTNVTISGGSALWNKMSDKNGNIKTWTPRPGSMEQIQAARMALLTDDWTAVKKLLVNVEPAFYDVEKLEYMQNHNIYGGGNLACNVGSNANVTINHSLVTDQNFIGLEHNTGLAWAASIDNKEHPQYSVFGGGYGPNTFITGNTNVTMQCGKDKNQDNSDFLYANKEADRQAWNDFFRSMVYDWNSNVSATDKENIYGGNNQAGIWRYAVAKLAWSPGLPNLIHKALYGGGYAGRVGGNANVHVSDYSCLRHLYGGGLGSKDYLDKYNDTNDTDRLYQRLGEVAGNTSVIIGGGVYSGNVFGGGAGMESAKLTADDADVTDFVDMARVKGTTMVNVLITGSPSVDENGTKGTVIFGDVFGGGDVANVGTESHAAFPTETSANGYFTSKVIVSGGAMMGQVFAGGNGRLKTQCSGTDGYTNLGAIYGNTLLQVDGYDKTSSVGQGMDTGGKGVTYLFKRIFGGGNNGSIKQTTISKSSTRDANTGNAYVAVNGGFIAYNVFGGGVGTVDIADDGTDNNTYSFVEGSTYVDMRGGIAIVDQYWDKPDANGLQQRQWAPLNIKDGKPYSPQYDPEAKKLLINHNIYGGCRNAGYVSGDTHIKMSRSYVRSAMRARGDVDASDSGYSFFETDEWREIYEKIGSPHFCVFGGGYGENTHVENNTWVDINIQQDADYGNYHPLDAADCETDGKLKPQEEWYKRFQGGQSVMDVIGGGYSGSVNGATHVKVHGDSYLRRVFGGAFYASCGSTNVFIGNASIDDVFGGGMMGDVEGEVNVQVGRDWECNNNHSADDVNDDIEYTDDLHVAVKAANSKIFILKNVYGGNDVSGIVGKDNATNVSIALNGGHIYGNVYGGGNGDYLYKIDQDVKVVSVDEDYEIEGKKQMIYRVPLRKDVFPSLGAMSNAQKIVNINSYRPVVTKTYIDFHGNSDADLLLVDGGIFGGGSSATVNSITGDEADSWVKLNVGSNIRVGKVFLGSDGDALFDNDNGFMTNFPGENGINLTEQINWTTDPANIDIPETLLPTKKNQRPDIYKHGIDLYFMPVEMNTMPIVTWGNYKKNPSNTTTESNKDAGTDKATIEAGGVIENAEIGRFVCGGNRGNMNTETPFHIYFPAGLTITGDIVGGCNNSNYIYTLEGKDIQHEGGFLLGTHKVGEDRNPQIYLTTYNKFRPTAEDEDGNVTTEASRISMYAEGNNVYGGCYNSGTVRGDILVDIRCNMIAGLDSIALRRTTDAERTVASAYGAGYGDKTWVYGDTEVRLGENTDCTSSGHEMLKAYQAGNQSAAVNYLFGGGRKGNVVGNTSVRVLNGRVGGCVVGASYAGVLYGNAQTMVGYPELYYRAKKNGIYQLTRADKDPTHALYKNDKGVELIKKEVRYTKGDLVSEAVYKEITDPQKAAKFDMLHSIPDNKDWTLINIQIDKAIYGGGYALPGSSVGTGDYTVKKYTEENRFDEKVIRDTYNFNSKDEIIGFGGNTFVMVGDVSGNYDIIAGTGITSDNSRDHISLSSRSLEEVATKPGDDLFGLYYQALDDDGNPTGNYLVVSHETPKTADDTQSYYRFIGEGGLYGDGHLSLSEGFRVADLTGFGYNGSNPTEPKLMNCVHRFDNARFKDCCVTLLGDRDYASAEGNAINASSYSVARVGEIQMESSIDPNGNYVDLKQSGLTAEQKLRSRNYIGLSNAQFELGAIISDDIFALEGGALYHDSKGKLITNGMTIEGTEAPNIKTFQDPLSYYRVKQWYLNEYQINSENSGYYDNINAQVQNERLFQFRNSATARNMFGIYSGYALNVLYYHYDESLNRDVPYYGPINGVFEVNLIGTRAGEAGGYAYAQNIHHETVVDSGNEYTTFLETSGNFVFPANEQRKVVDDCFPTGFSKNNRATAEGHYWYVTGFRYFFNGTITGYTYDGETKYFDMDNTAHLIYLPGTKQNQPITLKSAYFLNRHTVTFNPLEEHAILTVGEKYYTSSTGDGEFTKTADDGKGGAGDDNIYYVMSSKSKDCDIEHKLLTDKIPTSEELSAAGLTTYDQYWAATITGGTQHPGTNPYYNLSLSVSEEGTYKTKIGDVDVPHIEHVKMDKNNPVKMTAVAPCDDPVMGIRLTDLVNNNGKLGDGTFYYDNHLSEPCALYLTLTSPVVSENGDLLFDGYILITSIDQWPVTSGSPNSDKYFTLDANNDYVPVTKEEAEALLNDHKNVFIPTPDEYYAKVPDDANFQPGTTYYRDNGDGTYSEASDVTADNFESQKDGLYTHPGAAGPKLYEYNLTLTIKYIKGPSYKGKITIQNCALPGEKIRLSSSTVKVESDRYSLSFEKGFWTIGPGKKVWNDENDHTLGYHWELQDNTGTVLDDSGNNTHEPKSDTPNYYYPFNAHVSLTESETNTASPIFQGNASYFETNSHDFYIPAYYFMNGYVAKYMFKVTGIEDIYEVTIQPEDTLLIHNYHRMKPMQGAKQVETHIRKAAERYASDVTRYTVDKEEDKLNEQLCYVSRPRVYIENLDDMLEFQKYVNNSTDDSSAPGNDYGADLDFFLMTDVKVPASWSVKNFKGTFHGNGHVISGISSGNALFEANEGHVYNLGLAKGKITKEETPTLYHCCYTKGNNTVYRMDGTAYTGYTDNDWEYGKVAYDLNQYYLEERLDRNTDQAETDDAVKDTHDHTGYVEQIYANGDYQYARYRATGGDEYLRTQPVPLYITNNFQAVVELADKSQITNHLMSHDVDVARAYYAGGNLDEYRPLFEEAMHNTTADPAPSTLKNDYLFFGQYLSTTAGKQEMPMALVHTQREVETMFNRVWRAYGFYNSKVDNTYHFNRNAYVLDDGLTAIDFTGAHDASWSWNGGMTTATPKIYYPMIMDMPSRLTAFTVTNGITKNLLVYTDLLEADDIVSATAVNATLRYAESTSESAIKGHQVQSNAVGSYSTQYLHLVERQPGINAYRNDFNAPIAFSLTGRAWYTRQPLAYSNGNSAWEGLCLPFMVNRVEADDNGEITHFYKTAATFDASNYGTQLDGANMGSTHHEYWLRSLSAVADGDAGEKKATFLAPNAPESSSSDGDYIYKNTFFLDTYLEKNGYVHDAYGKPEGYTYTNYAFQQPETPYIVSFPGQKYYEFDLSNTFYNDWFNANRDAQNVTFNYQVVNAAGRSDWPEITIGVTDDKERSEDANGFAHIGTYSSIPSGDGIYGIARSKKEGDSFVYETDSEVAPFRTYMKAVPSPSPAPSTRTILICEEETGIDEMPHEDEFDEEGNVQLSVWTEGSTIVIDSPREMRVFLYHIDGSLIKVMNLEEGRNECPDMRRGIYIVAGQKVPVF